MEDAVVYDDSYTKVEAIFGGLLLFAGRFVGLGDGAVFRGTQASPDTPQVKKTTIQVTSRLHNIPQLPFHIRNHLSKSAQPHAPNPSRSWGN